MITPLITLFCLGSAVQGNETLHKTTILSDPATGKETGYVEQRSDPLSHPQTSPKVFDGTRWQFIWQTVTFEKLTTSNASLARFSVFSQERNQNQDTGFAVARMLERLWEYNYTHLNRDHSNIFGDGVVDVYLCKGGEPGGEQRFDTDRVNGSERKVNTIYLYDLETFKDPLEMAREVAHEYGHASLPGVNGYSEPEDWANGYLGEKLFLKHVDEAMTANLLKPDDAMGVSKDMLDAWVAKNIQPLIVKAAQLGPSETALKSRTRQGMDDFLGLALYMDTILPEKAFSRSLDLIASSNAEDYLEGILIAAQEQQASYVIQLPRYLVGKPIWLPLGQSKMAGATVSERKHGWVKVVGTSGPIRVTPPPHYAIFNRGDMVTFSPVEPFDIRMAVSIFLS